LVFGASGVGKSHACQEFIAANPNFLYFKASELLSKSLKKTPEQLRVSSEDSIVANQHFLVTSLAEARKGRETYPVLLDSHAVIDNDSLLVPVPVQAVALMEPDGLLLLEVDGQTILERRTADTRKRPERSLAQIHQEIDAERIAVEDYARILKLPLIKVTAQGASGLADAIDELYGLME
jgi:adenylate kinase